jgi:hypothetical protein
VWTGYVRLILFWLLSLLDLLGRDFLPGRIRMTS